MFNFYLNNVVGPLQFVPNSNPQRTLPFQLMIILPNTYINPPQFPNGVLTLNPDLKVDDYGGYYANSPGELMSQICQLASFEYPVETGDNKLFFRLGLMPVCSGSYLEGFVIVNNALYYLPDITNIDYNNITRYPAGYFTNNIFTYGSYADSGVFFGYYDTQNFNVPSSFFIPFTVTSYPPLLCGIAGGITIPHNPHQENLLMPMWRNINFSTFTETLNFNQGAGNLAPNGYAFPAVVSSYYDGTNDVYISSCMPGTPNTYKVTTINPTSLYFNSLVDYPTVVVGNTTFTSDLQFTIFQFPFYTPGGTLGTFGINGGINTDLPINTPALYYAVDSKWADVNFYFPNVSVPSPLGSTSIMGAMANPLGTPRQQYFMKNGIGSIFFAFGYTTMPKTAGSDIYDNLAYYQMIYNPGFYGMPDGYDALNSTQVSPSCSSGDTPLYIPLGSQNNPNTIRCRPIPPIINLPYGNIPPSAGTIIPGQPFHIYSQIQAFNLTNDYDIGGTAALMNLVNNSGVPTLQSFGIGVPDTFTLTPEGYIQQYPSGLYLNQLGGLLAYSSSPYNFFPNINQVFITWYNVGSIGITTQLVSSPSWVGTTNGIIVSGTNNGNSNFNNLYLLLLPTTIYTRNSSTIDSIIMTDWINSPTNFMTSPGWVTGSSTFSNLLDSSIGWFGGSTLAGVCGTVFGNCNNGYCSQNYQYNFGVNNSSPLSCLSDLFQNGIIGSTGAQGTPNRTPGSPGPQGAEGIKGNTGITGDLGPTGLKGEQPSGVSLFTSSLLYIFLLIVLIIIIILYLFFTYGDF